MRCQLLQHPHGNPSNVWPHARHHDSTTEHVRLTMCELLWMRLPAQLTLERRVGWEVVQRCRGTGRWAGAGATLSQRYVPAMRACSERALGSESFKIIFLKGSLSGFYNFTKHKHIHLQMCGRQGFSSQDSDTTQEKGSRPHCKAGTLGSRGIWVGTQCFSVQRGPTSAPWVTYACLSSIPAGTFLEDSKPQSRDGEAV